MQLFPSFLLGLILVITGVIGFSTYKFNTFKPQEVTWDVNPDNLKYFNESYLDCRMSFQNEADRIKELYEGVQISAIKIESRQDPDLTIDYCYVPAQNRSKRLFILSSGVHGIEGFVGSAVQQMYMKELAGETSLDDTGLLIIHGINPYGFKYKRRVSENNVDLNRNSTVDISLYESVNQGYVQLDTWLNPNQKISLTSARNLFFQLSALRRIFRFSMGTLRQATLQGQYQYEKGIFFGGSNLEPSIEAVTPLIQQTAEPYEMVFNIDLHTGYGANGTMHLFPNPLEDENKKAVIEKIFSGRQIDWGDSNDFYTFTGDFASYAENIIPDKYYLTMTFEFGTIDTQTTIGSIKALHNLVCENQGVHNGYCSEKDEEKTRSEFLEGYYPSSVAWRTKAIDEAREVLRQAMNNFRDL